MECVCKRKLLLSAGSDSKHTMYCDSICGMFTIDDVKCSGLETQRAYKTDMQRL